MAPLSDSELAAVVAAIALVWPSAPGAAGTPPPSTRWRFSGRWWDDNPPGSE